VHSPPPDAPAPDGEQLIARIRDRIVASVAASLGLTLDDAAARLATPIETALREEARALMERVDRAERFATVGQLASSVVHELRNPLSVIETSAFVIGERGQADARIVRHAKRIGEQVTLAGAIVSELLDAARGRPLEPHALDVATLIREAAEQIAPTLIPGIHITVPSPLSVLGDARRLRQVLVNLFQNAFDAMGGTGAVEASARRDGDRVVLTIRDHGPGIPPSISSQLFEPLVTTKPGGTGLGLALSREIVRGNGGDITAHTHPDGGASFEITLLASGDVA